MKWRREGGREERRRMRKAGVESMVGCPADEQSKEAFWPSVNRESRERVNQWSNEPDQRSDNI